MKYIDIQLTEQQHKALEKDWLESKMAFRFGKDFHLFPPNHVLRFNRLVPPDLKPSLDDLRGLTVIIDEFCGPDESVIVEAPRG